MRERCEGCGAIATGHDADGIPLCDDCAEEMLQAEDLARGLAPAEQALTDHLAEQVCGWTKYAHKHIGKPCYKSQGVFERSCDSFDPIHDPRDTDVVMRAWRKYGKCLALTIAPHYMSARTPDCPRGNDQHYYAESWTGAVCEAIARASGFDGEGK